LLALACLLPVLALASACAEVEESSEEPVAVATEEAPAEAAAEETTEETTEEPTQSCPDPEEYRHAYDTGKVSAECEALAEEQLAQPEVEEPQDTESVSQANAILAASSYLETMAFSREGLIEQLEYEGYSHKDAVYAVDEISPNWKEQAAKAAQSYLDTMPFSRSGLIQQLEYEGYTPAQAEYAVRKVGL
jgi:colicin import membrane protein